MLKFPRWGWTALAVIALLFLLPTDKQSTPPRPAIADARTPESAPEGIDIAQRMAAEAEIMRVADKASADVADAYAIHVIGRGDQVECTHIPAQGRIFVRCDGTGVWIKRAAWLVDGINFYAINGKANGLLSKLQGDVRFRPLPVRTKVDTGAVVGMFDTLIEPTTPLVTYVSEQMVSNAEFTVYCAYAAAKWDLMQEATRRFGENPYSEARFSWIEPKLEAMIAERFTAKGHDYYAIMGRINTHRLNCPD